MSPDPGAIVEQAEEMREEPPRPLTRQMPPADAFPVDALGDVLGAAARAIHDLVQAPLAICSQSVLAAAALAVQAHADIELPMGHIRPVSDYFATVAETGARKSASDTEATWPIRKREQSLRETRGAVRLAGRQQEWLFQNAKQTRAVPFEHCTALRPSLVPHTQSGGAVGRSYQEP
jgi:uncharacterized protein DUF3987